MLQNIHGDNFIFILDDLERCTVDIQELLGCISDIAEQDSCKFIIVGNENEIKNQANIKE